MELLETVKGIVAAHDEGKRYWPIFISYPSWEQPGPLFAPREESQKWLDDKIARGREGDWGYVTETVAQKQPVGAIGEASAETLEVNE
jgi:hypothetical protein